MSLASRARLIRAIRSGDYYAHIDPATPHRDDQQPWSHSPLKPECQPQAEPPGPPPEPEPPPPPSAPVVSAASSPEPEPEPEPAPLDEIADAIYDLFPEYLACSNHQRALLTLWIFHTYCFDAFPATPYLNIYSPEKQTGKTLCLQLLRMLCHNSWMPAGGLTATRLMDNIAKRQPTLLLDDWHTAFRSTEAQSIIGFLNAGFAENSLYPTRGSEDREIYCPKAFAGSESLPAPLVDRSIPIVLQRHRSSQSLRMFCSAVLQPQTEYIAKALRLWFEDDDRRLRVYHQADSLFAATFPGFSLRQKACALPLLVIARLIGGKWPRRANLALRRAFGIHTAESFSTALQLLQDIRAFFLSTPKERIFTKDLLQHLNDLAGRPWSRDQKGKPLNPNSFRCYLENFDICRSSNQWIDKQNLRGFKMQDFVRSWDSYLPPLPATDSVPPSASQVVESAPEIVETSVQVVENNSRVVETAAQVVENSPQVVEN